MAAAARARPGSTAVRARGAAPAPEGVIGLLRRGRRPEPAPADLENANHWARTAALCDRVMAEGSAALRPHYTWCLLHVAGVARHLGYEAFTAIEFGCAGGNGLVALEEAGERVRELVGVSVEIHGFDNATGLPAPVDHRDAPYIHEQGHFPMDVDALRARLRTTTLHLGLVGETLPRFIAADTAPVGFVIQDLDFHSSTSEALRLYDAAPEGFLPRVISYYDDTLGYPWGASNGERLANAEFNATRHLRRIDELPGMRYVLPPSQFHARWTEALCLVHILDHPRYSDYEGTAISTRLDLRES